MYIDDINIDVHIIVNSGNLLRFTTGELCDININIFPTMVVGKNTILEGKEVISYLKNGYISDMDGLKCPLNKFKDCRDDCGFLITIIKGGIIVKSCSIRLQGTMSIMSKSNTQTTNEIDDLKQMTNTMDGEVTCCD